MPHDRVLPFSHRYARELASLVKKLHSCTVYCLTVDLVVGSRFGQGLVVAVDHLLLVNGQVLALTSSRVPETCLLTKIQISPEKR